MEVAALLQKSGGKVHTVLECTMSQVQDVAIKVAIGAANSRSSDTG